MANALTPDELGEAGENLFAKLCAQAKLICSRTSRDRAGWDFRVEFPMETSADETLDQRDPRACMVQLKCTAGESGSVRARLSAMERLAKDRGPAAIIVFRMRPDGTELMGYVLHLLNKDLAKILRRLRVAEADGRTDINHIWMSFDYRKGRKFKPDADGLRQALAAICPADVDAYVETKRHQLATLGYEDGERLEGDALIWIEDQDHFLKIISGQVPLKPVQLQAYDRRFGIRVPYKGTLLESVEEFPIDLPTIGPCTIIVRAGPLTPAAVFECETAVPFPVQGGPMLSIRHPALNFLFFEGNFHLESVGNFKTDQHDLATWIPLLRALTYLASGDATVELEFGGARIPRIPTPEGLDGPYLDELPRLLEFVERFGKALEIAGIVNSQPFSLEDIWATLAMQMSLDIMFNVQSAACFEFDAIGGVTDEERLEAIYFNTVEFAGRGITFATKVMLERSGERSNAFKSTGFTLLDVRPAVVDLDEYGAEMATTHGANVVIDPKNVTMVSRPASGR
ncbi:hypothetical protein [Novosphingobium sp.]|jgi:hypothetical protein|uniref:hypothetical protein n=1 Tax=Novosphingobium sp. TaxID=1874826 RepID=UPI002FE08A02